MRTGDVIGRDGQRGVVAEQADDVQVRHARFHLRGPPQRNWRSGASQLEADTALR